MHGTIVERLARRYAADDSDTAFVASSQLLQLATTGEDKDLVLCARRERLVAPPDYEPYELEEFGEVHVDGYYGALLAAARIRPLQAAA